jgi:phage-related protein
MAFGGTVKLTGESEYKKALADITSNLKVLNSEMKVVTSQYDKNDKSTENLTQQNDVLNKKIEEQKEKVDILSKALADAEQETGKNSSTSQKWQIQLNNAQAELNKLVKDVENNEKAMEQSADATEENADAVEEFGKEADESGKSALKLGDIIKANLISDAIKAGLTALVDGVKAVGGAMKDSITAGAGYADTFLTMSVQTGISTENLQKYNAVAELVDVSTETMTKSMAKNIKSMTTASSGTGAMAEAYAKLGVKVTDADGKLRDSETVYWETIDALKNVTDETERDSVAMELLGKSAQELNPLIAQGSEGIKAMGDEAVKMGAVLSEDALSALGAVDDEMQRFGSISSATSNILASAFAPAMSTLMGGVNDVGQAFNGLITAVIGGDSEGVKAMSDEVMYAIGDMMDFVWTALEGIGEIIPELINTFLSLITENLPYILDHGANMVSYLLEGIAGYIPELIPVVLTIVETLVNTILENLPMILEMGIKMIVSLIDGIADMLPELIPMAIDCILTIVDTLLDNLDLIIDSAINIIMALADGLLEALPDLVDRVPVIINKLLDAIFRNFPKILDAGIEITLALADGLIDAIPQLLEALPMIIGKLIRGLLDAIPQLIDAGGDLLAGLAKGLLNPTTIWNTVKGLFNGIVGGIKELFGIHSPSKVFEDEVGKNLALGLGEGFDATMSDVATDMANAIPTEFDADINTRYTAGAGYSNGSTYDMMVSAFKQALTEVNVVMDGRKMGAFVTDTVERVVYA